MLVADAAGERLLSATFAHDEAGLRSLCRALVRLEVELVAIERPDGLLVERLLDAGVRILALHPNQVAATRDRFRASGGRSDRFDAFVLCELARTDHHRFRVLEPDSDQTKAPRFGRVADLASIDGADGGALPLAARAGQHPLAASASLLFGRSSVWARFGA